DEWGVYKAYLDELEQQREAPNVAALDKELEELKRSEQQLLSELGHLKEEEQHLKDAIAQEEQEREQLHEQEESYWR
ncbi:hypothetical protein KR026_004590, partial [Drosophila bipectinata]